MHLDGLICNLGLFIILHHFWLLIKLAYLLKLEILEKKRICCLSLLFRLVADYSSSYFYLACVLGLLLFCHFCGQKKNKTQNTQAMANICWGG